MLSHCLILKKIPFKFCFRFVKRFSRKKRRLIFLFFLTFSAIMSLLFYIFYVSCSHSEVERALSNICDRYLSHKSVGNMCSDLCRVKRSKSFSCIPNHLGKDVVFSASLEDRQFIVKSRNLDPNKLEQIFWLDENRTKVYPNSETFFNMVFNNFKTNLNINLDIHKNKAALISPLWYENISNFTQLSESHKHAVMSDLWLLTQQNEYLMLKFFKNKHIFPEILGNCGHFYVEEYVKPLDNWMLMLYPSWHETFSNRAKVALKIINFLEMLENYFDDLQLCDVKVGHFGVDNKGRIKLLDLDMVFHMPALIQNIVSVENCTTDDDCSFIDCKSICDLSSSQCRPIVINSNLQRICSNIFLGRMMPKYFGLLGSPSENISIALQLVLQECVESRNTEIVNIRVMLKQILEKL